MKKRVSLLVVFSIMLSSCATILGGSVSTCQRTKPLAGQPSRAVRPVAAIADVVLFWPGLVVDFATGAIYRPCDKNVNPITVQSMIKQKNAD